MPKYQPGLGVIFASSFGVGLSISVAAGALTAYINQPRKKVVSDTEDKRSTVLDGWE